MNSRGQAALEYLMTYGWALVIIVVVAGILFFIMSSPTAGVTCNSSDPAKVPVQSANLPKGADGVIKLINGTAGTIVVGTVTGLGDLNAAATTATTVTGGNVITITQTGIGSRALQTGTQVTVNYTDQFSYAKSVIVTCQGTPT